VHKCLLILANAYFLSVKILPLNDNSARVYAGAYFCSLLDSALLSVVTEGFNSQRIYLSKYITGNDTCQLRSVGYTYIDIGYLS